MMYIRINRDRRILLCLCLILLHAGLLAQSFDFPEASKAEVQKKLSEYMRSGDFAEGLRYFEMWERQPDVVKDTAAYWDIRIKRSLMYIPLRKPDSSLIVLGEAPQYLSERFPTQSASHKIQLGRIYLHSGELRKSAEVLEQALVEIEENQLHPDEIVISTPLINTGLAYNQFGDYDKALNRLERARVIMEQMGTSDPRQLGTLHYNIASVYSNLGKWDDYVKQMRLAHEANIEAYGEEHRITANSLNSIGNGVKMTGSDEEALEIYFESLEIFERVARPDHPQKAVVELNIGETLQDMNRFDEALPYLHASARHRVANYGYRHYRVERAYKSIAQTYAQMNRFDEASAHIDTALYALKYDPDASNPYAGVDGLFNLFYAMSRKAEILHRKAVFEDSEQSEIAALEAYENGIRVLKDLRLHFKGRLSQGSLNQKSYLFYEPAIEMCFMLYNRTGEQGYIDRAFALADESKDNDYYDNLRQQEETISSTISSEMSNLERKYQESLARISSDLYDTDVDSMKLVLLDSLSILENQYDKFQNELKSKYPEYYQMMYSDARIDIVELERELSKADVTLASYFIGDSLAFLFVAQPGKAISGLQLDYPSRLADVSRAINSGRQFYLTDIYSEIFEPLEKQLTDRGLIIIPDGALAFVPFEAFELGSGLMALHAQPISYASSARTFLKTEESHTAGEGWLGIAPRYEGELLATLASRSSEDSILTQNARGNWIDLPGARDEVNKIAALVKGDKWLEDKATESSFKRSARDYNILHLSMHAWLDDENPMLSTLVFSQDSDTIQDGYLYAHEILGMDLKAEMAVLSACQTGVGKLRRGEGVLSISRAFRTAGVPSSVMSLWKVPDASTSIIMSSFYQYLEQGVSKSEALRQAKIEYLESASQPEQKLPYYWAGFIVHGDPSPISSGKINWSHLFILASLVIVIALLIIYRNV